MEPRAIQSTELQISQFASQPLENKPVWDVPGVGPRLAENLENIGIVQTIDLYNELKKVDFSERKFREWMTLHVSKRARVSTIYRALRRYWEQFECVGARCGDSQALEESDRVSIDLSNEKSTAKSHTDPIPSSDLKRKATLSSSSHREKRAKERRYSTSDDSDDSVYERISKNKQRSQANKQLMQYIYSFSHIFRNIPQEFHREFRRDILDLAEKYEDKILSKSKEYPLATSSSCEQSAHQPGIDGSLIKDTNK